MSKLLEIGVTLLSTTNVNLNVVASTNLYTVPVGKKLTLILALGNNASDDALAAQATIGQSGSKADFLPTQTMSGLSAAGAAIIMQPIPNVTPLTIVEYPAGIVIVFDVTQQAGAACTADIDLLGKLKNA